MSKKQKKAGKARAGRGKAAGAAFRPADLPDDETKAADPQPGAVPMGLPISAEEYEKLQRQARHAKLPPAGCAQEDSSA
jgi:hypothetical protein